MNFASSRDAIYRDYADTYARVSVDDPVNAHCDREPLLHAHAMHRPGNRATFRITDLEQRLEAVPTASIDGVVASLVLHYIED